MKKLKYIFTCIIAVAVISCDKNELDPVPTQEAGVITIESASQSVVVDSDNVSYNLVVGASTTSFNDRVVGILVSDASDAPNFEYSFAGNVVIQAGETTGSTSVGFNFDAIPTGVPRSLTLQLADNSAEQVTVDYEKICQSNDIELNIVFDAFPGETTWEIRDSGGALVASGDGSGAPEFTEGFTLADGTYTFTIFDSFGDGICCSWGEGSYTITKPACSETLAEGGEFGSSDSVEFSVP